MCAAAAAAAAVAAASKFRRGVIVRDDKTDRESRDDRTAPPPARVSLPETQSHKACQTPQEKREHDKTCALSFGNISTGAACLPVCPFNVILFLSTKNKSAKTKQLPLPYS